MLYGGILVDTCSRNCDLLWIRVDPFITTYTVSIHVVPLETRETSGDSTGKWGGHAISAKRSDFLFLTILVGHRN